jgi:hypothetical protein
MTNQDEGSNMTAVERQRRRLLPAAIGQRCCLCGVRHDPGSGTRSGLHRRPDRPRTVQGRASAGAAGTGSAEDPRVMRETPRPHELDQGT